MLIKQYDCVAWDEARINIRLFLGFSLPCLSLLSPSLALLLHEGMFPPGDWDFDDAESGDREGEGNKLNRKEAGGRIRIVEKRWCKITWDVWGKMVYVWDK